MERGWSVGAAVADDEWQEGTVPSLVTLGGDEHGERSNGALDTDLEEEESEPEERERGK